MAQFDYRKDIMESCRQRMGLDKDDTSHDADIWNMSHEKVFSEYCKWHGLMGNWSENLLSTIQNIYGIELE